MSKDIYLLLADGTAYKGKSFGAEGETLGEVVFSTGMVGYLETITDPCYFGQIVVQTFPLIGNYGVIPEDFESETPQLKGYIVREWCDTPSNFRSNGDIDALLKEKNIPPKNIFYISLDDLNDLVDCTIRELVDLYLKKFFDANLRTLDEKVFIFIDESQNDKKWECKYNG